MKIDPELPATLVEILSDEELKDFLHFREEVSYFHAGIPLQHILRVVSTKEDVSVNNSTLALPKKAQTIKVVLVIYKIPLQCILKVVIDVSVNNFAFA